MINVFSSLTTLLQIFILCVFIATPLKAQLPDWDGFTINPAEVSQKKENEPKVKNFSEERRKNPSKYIKTYRAKGVSFNVVWCPPGTFRMGSSEEEILRERDEVQHQVTLTKGFWMMETEVTQELYLAVMGKNPSLFINSGLQAPVERVNWEDAANFVSRLNKITGKQFGLPTEAQWEYACRAGTETPFNTGKDLTTLQANYNESGEVYKGEIEISEIKTKPVQSFAPNAWGLYDMHGNVSEWCADWYGGAYLPSSVTDPFGSPDGNSRVLRGGNFNTSLWFSRSASRNLDDPDIRSSHIGFRLISSK